MAPSPTARRRPPRLAVPATWRRAGRVFATDSQRDGDVWGSAVMGDPCIVRDEDDGSWRMFLFALPPGHAHAVCRRDPSDPDAWRFEGPLRFTNADVLEGEAAFKPFVVMNAHEPGRAARIDGRHALLLVTNDRAKVVRRAWATSLGGPWTLEPNVLIDRGQGDDFDAKHVDAVSGYFFPEEQRFVYFYMGYPTRAQPHPLSPFGSAQGAAVERVGTGVTEKTGPILRPAERAGHWASGWVGGLQLLPAADKGWLAVVNASPTAPDPADTSMTAEEPPPSLGGFAVCDEQWPTRGWRWRDQPIERIDEIPDEARREGERVNLWRHFALPLEDGRLALFYNSGDYFQEKLFLKLSVMADGPPRSGGDPGRSGAGA